MYLNPEDIINDLEQFFKSPSGSRAIVYAQDNLIQVKIYKIDQQNWPQLIEQKVFKSQFKANSFLSQNTFFIDQSIRLDHLQYWGDELRSQSLTVPTNSAVLWKAEHQWNWDWEIKFANWLQTQVDVDFFVL